MAVASAGSLSPDHSCAPSTARSSATFGPIDGSYSRRRHSSSSERSKAYDNPAGNPNGNVNGVVATDVVPEVNINGAPLRTARPPKSSTGPVEAGTHEAGWGSNFWVTLVDPQTNNAFFACPATGQVSWDAPVGNFVLPPNEEGEWWELSDQSRDGLPYYYQTKTGETVWERPEGFVIPLGIIQNTSLGRRLSQTAFHRNSIMASDHRVSIIHEFPEKETENAAPERSVRNTARRSRSFDRPQPSTRTAAAAKTPPTTRSTEQYTNRTANSSASSSSSRNGHGHHLTLGIQLPPIPGSPYATDADPGSPPESPNSNKSHSGKSSSSHRTGPKSTRTNESRESLRPPATPPRNRAKSSAATYIVPHRSPPPQSLGAAVEMLAQSDSASGGNNLHVRRSVSENAQAGGARGPAGASVPKLNLNDGLGVMASPARVNGRDAWGKAPPSPSRPIPSIPNGASGATRTTRSASGVSAKGISGPVMNHEAAMTMSPVQNRLHGSPIPVEVVPKVIGNATATLASGYVPPPKSRFWHNAQRKLSFSSSSLPSLSPRTPSLPSSSLPRRPDASSATYPILPHDLASDIQQFSESQYARQYFSTHRTGFIFRRTVPVAQMMTWQKGQLSGPLLTLNRSLKGDAVKVFKVIQRIMGDREREAGGGGGARVGQGVPTGSMNAPSGNNGWLLEEERWLLGEGLTHGELRDEIYCQLMKQLSGNPNPESVFKGWQMLCVLLVAFPPSKNFEAYLRSFMQQHTTHQEGRVDVMAKHCLRRLEIIAKKGPRGKAPSIAEIETASDAAFNPSTFGESLDAIVRLQERNYPHQKVPIILPFLADGMLALGGTKSEGIFRVPGDSDSISELKLRIDRGYYTLDDIDDPNILASLMKLWLRELCDPLVPEEMYNDCITNSKDPEACVQMVQRLPTINRRVILFVVSFLQLFLKDEIQAVTKMTPVNLALVMAPNLLRCNSESMAVVFTNAQYEQIFVYNLLLHLKCNESDSEYIPTHGLQNSNIATTRPRDSRSRVRRSGH